MPHDMKALFRFSVSWRGLLAEEMCRIWPPAGATTPTTVAASGGATAASNVSKSDVDNAKTIAIIAVIVGAIGFLFGAAGLAIGRRKRA